MPVRRSGLNHQFFLSVGYREARFGHRICPQTFCNAPELAPGIFYRSALSFGPLGGPDCYVFCDLDRDHDACGYLRCDVPRRRIVELRWDAASRRACSVAQLSSDESRCCLGERLSGVGGFS